MSEEAGFFGRLWANQHGKQFGISATAAGASGILLVACMVQLLFLQDHAEWNDYTGGAIIGAVVSLIVFLVAFPEFLRFRGYVTLLEELKEINPHQSCVGAKPKASKRPKPWALAILKNGTPSLISEA